MPLQKQLKLHPKNEVSILSCQKKNEKDSKTSEAYCTTISSSIAKHRCFFDRKRSNTFFKHRMLHKSTWYNNDGRTQKVFDYIREICYIHNEKYVQNYMTD